MVAKRLFATIVAIVVEAVTRVKAFPGFVTVVYPAGYLHRRKRFPPGQFRESGPARNDRMRATPRSRHAATRLPGVGHLMVEAARPGIATHFLRYSLGSVLVMLAGVVSFPVMARLLDYTQYGLLGIFDSVLLVLAAVFKFGGQHAVLRFYPHRGGADAVARYGASLILIPFLGSCLLWGLAMLVFAVFPQFAHFAREATGWLALASLLPTIWISMVAALMMAQERSEWNVLINVGSRWLNVAVVLGIVYFVSRTALGVYAGRLIVECVIAVVLAVWMWRQAIPLRWRNRDWRLVSEGMRYGVPLMANEISAILLVSIDRLKLEGLTGNTGEVGIYNVGASLALQVSVMLHAALSLSYTQVSFRQFETEGAAAVVRSKRRILHVLVYVVAAMLAGLVVVGRDGFLLLSGPSKAASVPVFVLLCCVFVLAGLFELCTAGLRLYKRTFTLFVLTLLAALVNALLNLFLIPRFGVMGAVYATLGSGVIFVLGNAIACPRELLALPGARATAYALVLGVLVWWIAWVTHLFGFTSHPARLMAMALLELVLFAGPALVLDRTLRNTLLEQWQRWRSRLA
jgi:O-antigen/teichoic acid export membrane protein